MPLTAIENRLIRLFSAAVVGDNATVREIRMSAPPPEPNRAWREALLQIHLFAGFPRQIEAFEAVLEAGGLGTLDADELEGDAPEPVRGVRLFRRIYAKGAPDVRTRLARLHPDAGRWIVEHAYARVLSRPGLSPRVRELLAVAALTTLGQTKQLASHARGAVRCGATPEEVHDTFALVADMHEGELREELGRVVDRFAGR